MQIKELDILNVNIPLIDPELFCDVSCLMFDQSDPRSFECVAHIYTVRRAAFSFQILFLGQHLTHNFNFLLI